MNGEVLAFDIETVPDAQLIRRLLDLEPGLPDADAVRAMEQLRMQKTGGHSFAPLHLHRVVCVSVVYRDSRVLRVKSLEGPEASEADILGSFFGGIEQAAPRLVSWNGRSFDVPVLIYRALRHGISAARFWETGDGDRDFRFNNYQNRYHERHTDLMDLLSGYNLRSAISLDDCATTLGFPGKGQGPTGADVWPMFQEGKIDEIRQYCERDALNTYLVYLAFERTRGRLLTEEFEERTEELREHLQQEDQPHFQQFLEDWERAGTAG